VFATWTLPEMLLDVFPPLPPPTPTMTPLMPLVPPFFA
jgi:hypothetical protein